MKVSCVALALALLITLAVCTPSSGANNWTWTKLDYPGASWTGASGVYGGTIVGSYGTGAPGSHGYVYDGTTWRTLDYPGASSTEAYGVSGSNIVGTYTDTAGLCHGFLYDGTNWRSIDYPGAFHSYVYGVSGNTVVGNYTDHGGMSPRSRRGQQAGPSGAFPELLGPKPSASPARPS